jgi:hypothetical protein
MRISVRIISVLAKIQNEHILNTTHKNCGVVRHTVYLLTIRHRMVITEDFILFEAGLNPLVPLVSSGSDAWTVTLI